MTRVRLRPPLRAGRIARKDRRSFSLRRAGAGAALAVLTAGAALAGPAFAPPAHAATTPQYKLTIVGGAGTELFGINKNGDVFGIALEKGAKVQEGFLLRAGTTNMVFLGSPGDQANANSSSSPEAINASADVVGSATSFATGNTDLNAPGTGAPGADASANAINDNGVIVGQGGNGHAFVYQNGQATDLNSLIAAGSGFTLLTADGINDSGVIVGTAASSNGQTFGFELTPAS